jgi:hypothetical protein
MAEESDDEEEDEVEVQVKSFSYRGQNYVISTDSIVYDPKTSEPVGKYNAATDTIEELELESEDEEEEDEE